MYTPAVFEQIDIEILHDLMRSRPLATLVTLSSDGITANHIPLHLRPAPSPYGILQGHVARSNPLWSDLTSAEDVLAIFNGPNAYISPSWYATKQLTGKVVPTWNYVAVHAYGSLRVIDDAAWIRSQLEAMTAENETSFKEPWAVSDAPNDFTEQLITGVVGIEVVITRLSGKWKLSQNQPAQNRESVIQGLRSCHRQDAEEMANWIETNPKP